MASTVDAALELSQGASPWDLAQVRRVLEQPAQPGRHMDALRAIDLVVERRLRVSGELSVQRGFVGEVNLPGANGPATIQLAAVAKASFRFSAARSGEFRVRLTRDGSDILLDLSRTRSRRQEREFKAGIEIGIKGLDGLAQGWLDKLLPAIDDDLRGKLEQWSKPGSAFATQIRKELGKRWGEHLQPLAEVVLGEVTAKETAETLSKLLIDRWSEMLDERIGMVGERAESVAARLLEDTAAEGSLSAQAMAAIHAAVIKSITSLQSNIRAEVGSYVGGLQGRTENQLTKLLSPLQAVGEKVAELVAAVDDTATKVVSAIESLLKRYETLRKSLTTAAQKAAALKLGINFEASSSYETGESREICIRFGPGANADAAAHFRRLVLGHGEVALDAVGAMEAAGAGVRVEGGGFSAYAKRDRSISFSLDLFGLSFSDARALSSEVTIDVDASGRVRAFDSSATQTRVSSNPRTRQSASFSADFDLIAADSGRLPGTMGLAFELSGTEALSQKALSQFLGSFVEAGLLAPDRAASAMRRLEDRTDQRLSVSVTLNGLDSVMEKAALIPVETLKEDVLHDCMRFMRKRSDVAGRHIPRLPFDALFDWVKRAGGKNGADRAAHETIRTVLKGLSLETRLGGDMNRISREYRALYHASICIPATVSALAAIGQLAVATRSRALSDDEAIAARNRLDDLIQALQRAATPAVDVSDSIYRYLSERLPDRTVALLAAMARLGANSDFRADLSFLPR